MLPPLLAVDFDGTVSESDMLVRVVRTFGAPRVVEEAEALLDARKIGLHEVIRREMSTVKVPLAEPLAMVLRETRIRRGFSGLVTLAESRGWRFLVISSGFSELIQPVLEQAGLAHVELVANRLSPEPSGWEAHFAPTPICDVCREPCKRSLLEVEHGPLAARPFAYVGDGVSDRCPAELAEPAFARTGLARFLDRRAKAYHAFDDFESVAATLAARWP